MFFFAFAPAIMLVLVVKPCNTAVTYSMFSSAAKPKRQAQASNSCAKPSVSEERRKGKTRFRSFTELSC